MSTVEPTMIALPIPDTGPLNLDVEDLDWERPVHHPALMAFTVGSMLFGFIAEALPQAPPQVSWAFVALSAIGVVTLWMRLHYGYATARLNIDRIQGENSALKGELAAIKAARRSLDPGPN